MPGEVGYEYTFGKTLLEVKDLNVSYPDENGNMIPILKNVNFNILNISRPGRPQGQVDALLAPSGMGKCLAKGTRVLMFDGSIKPVEQVVIGDQLMGPDSTPRNVTGLGHGFGEMFSIVPTKGESYTVNGPHILSLELTPSKSSPSRRVEISVDEYLRESNHFKSRAKTYRVGVEFSKSEVPFDPYMLGLWLADDDSNLFSITNKDAEVVDHLIAFSTHNRLRISPRTPNRYGIHAQWDRKTSPTSMLRGLGVLNNKHIPTCFLVNDRETRLAVLAGLIDGDGHLTSNCFEITTKFEQLAKDILFLTRSLGLAAYCKVVKKRAVNSIGTHSEYKDYYRIQISGHTDMVPTKITAKRAAPRKKIKNVLRSGFEVVPQGIGEYFGFELDGDKLFLLGDFTVTHNTQLFRSIAGLNKIQSGSIQINPKGDDTMVPVHTGLVGVVAQDYPLFNHLTVLDNLLMAALIKNHDRAAAKKDVLDFLDRFLLSDKAHLYPHQLSGGQRQRVAIIQQMVCDNHLLLMDEPFSGLDIIMKDEVQNLISGVASQNDLNSVIITTHDIQSAIAVADTILLLGRERDATGKIIPGAMIKYTYNLMELGLAWHPNMAELPAFAELEKEIKARFREL